jgi:hypothetical protein
MLEKFMEANTNAIIKVKDYAKTLRSDFERYSNKTDTQIKALTERNDLLEKHIHKKVHSFLNAIPMPKADNELIFSKLKADAQKISDKLQQDVDIQVTKTLSEHNKETQNIKSKLDTYIDKKISEIQKLIKSEISKIPKPKNGKDGRNGKDGKDGKDAIINYAKILKELDLEVCVRKVDYDITENKLIVTYTNDKKEEVNLKATSIYYGGGGGTSSKFDFASLEEVASISSDDFVVLIRDGKPYKVKASLLGTSTPEGTVTYNGDPVTYNGDPVTYNGDIVVNT